MCLPSSSVTVTAGTQANRETKGEIGQQRHKELEKDKARVMDRGPDRGREKKATLTSTDRSVAPSSGKERPDNTLSTRRDSERERRMHMEKPKDGERGRDSDRPRNRHKESRRSNERTREKEKGRDIERGRGHCSKSSAQKTNSPPSPRSYSMPPDTERRDGQRGDTQSGDKSSCCPGGKSSSGRIGENTAISRANELPAHRTHRATQLDSKMKDHPHCYHDPQSKSDNYRHKDRPTGTHRSPALSGSWSKDRDMQSRSRNETKVEKEGWKQERVDEFIKGGKWQRYNEDALAEKKRGGHWEDEPDELERRTKWELEEGERPSSSSSGSSSGSSRKSSSSSASQGSSSDERGKEWEMKQNRHKREKRQASPQLLEGGEVKKHKTSRRSRDGGEQ